MVLSKILTKVEYLGNSSFDAMDKEHSSPKYSMEIFGKEYLVTLGKIRTEYSSDGAVYYPIYLLNKHLKITSKIGIFEAETHRAASLLDEDNDIDINLFGEPLLFPYVDMEYLDKKGKQKEESRLSKEPQDVLERRPEQKSEIEDIVEMDDSEEDEDVFTIPISKKTPMEKVHDLPPSLSSDHITVSEVLIKDLTSSSNIISTWPPETMEDSQRMNKEYKTQKSAQDHWIIQFMKNKHYNTFRNSAFSEDGNDPFFACIRDAYSDIGIRTTITKLRKLLSQEATSSLFQTYKKNYDELMVEKKVMDEEMSKIKKTNSALKKQSKFTKHIHEQKDILLEGYSIGEEYEKLVKQQKLNAVLLAKWGFMENMKTVENLETYMQTSSFPIDHWAMMTLEQLLSIKLIVLDRTEDADSCLQCEIYHQDVYNDFEPKYYLMISFDTQYELITYKNKRLFQFNELPYSMKTLVVNKCVEKENSGFASIPAFRTFVKDEFNLDINRVDTKDELKTNHSLYDPELVLSFHEGSDSKKMPGDVVHADKIPILRRTEFSTLAYIPDWRKKLDDSWSHAMFTINGKRWTSVEHYLLAIPFKESDPKLFNTFSADSNTSISKSVKLARDSLRKKKGEFYDLYKKKQSDIENDIDAYRKEALRAKFTQNNNDKGFHNILIETRNAKLEKFQRGQPPYTDIALMEIRDELQND